MTEATALPNSEHPLRPEVAEAADHVLAQFQRLNQVDSNSDEVARRRAARAIHAMLLSLKRPTDASTFETLTVGPPDMPIPDSDIAYLIEANAGLELLKTAMPILHMNGVVSDPSGEFPPTDAAPEDTADTPESERPKLRVNVLRLKFDERASSIWTNIANELAKADYYELAEEAIGQAQPANGSLESASLAHLTHAMADSEVRNVAAILGKAAGHRHYGYEINPYTRPFDGIEWDLIYEAIACQLPPIVTPLDVTIQESSPVIDVYPLMLQLRQTIATTPDMRSRLSKLASLFAKAGFRQDALLSFQEFYKHFILLTEATWADISRIASAIQQQAEQGLAYQEVS